MHSLQQKKTLVTLLMLFLGTSVFLGSFAPQFAYAASYADLTNGIEQGSNNLNDIDFGCASIPPDFTGCLAFAAYQTMKVANWLSIQAGVLLNYAILHTVVGMGSFVDQIGGIDAAWRALRDIANVFLVFLTVFVGIATILGVSGYGYKQLLWRVLLAALLVNFSITIAKVVIDVSNLAATEAYAMFLNSTDGTTKIHVNDCTAEFAWSAATADDNPCITHGVPIAFQDKLKSSTIFDEDATRIKANFAGQDDTVRYQTMFNIALMGTLLGLVMAFVFGAAAFMLIARFVILLFVIIVSPLALVLLITGVSGAGKRWWSMLLKQSFLAPMLMVTWWVAYQVMIGVVDTINLSNATLSEGATMQLSAMVIFLNFAIVIGLLIASLILARSMGAYGASAAIKTGSSWSRKAGFAIGAGAGAMTAGSLGWAGRHTVGRMAMDDANSKKYNNMAATGNWAQKKYANAMIAGNQKIASSSFDARSMSKTAQKYAGKAGGKGGFNAYQDLQVKRENAVLQGMKNAAPDPKDAKKTQKSLADVNKKYKQMQNPQRLQQEVAKQEELLDKAQKNATLADADRIHTMHDELEVKKGHLQRAQEYDTLPKDKKKELMNEQRVAERNAILKGAEKKRVAEGRAMADTYLDHESTKKNFAFFPTTTARKEVLGRVRKSHGQTKEEQAIDTVKKIIEDAEGTTAKEPSSTDKSSTSSA